MLATMAGLVAVFTAGLTGAAAASGSNWKFAPTINAPWAQEGNDDVLDQPAPAAAGLCRSSLFNTANPYAPTSNVDAITSLHAAQQLAFSTDNRVARADQFFSFRDCKNFNSDAKSSSESASASPSGIIEPASVARLRMRDLACRTSATVSPSSAAASLAESFRRTVSSNACQ